MRALRPVGNRILRCRSAETASVEKLVAGYRISYLNSGTAALALAILLACKRTSAKHPEVILPAYGCPDLVAAAVHAGARPVLADLRFESPEYDLEALAGLLNDNTVAVVAATFLGIRPDATRLRALIGSRNIVLVEDSAQWFPRNPTQRFFGDYVVASFGRGKPVNILGGGALLAAEHMELPSLAPGAGADGFALIESVKVALYNALIRPRIYGLAERMPFLGIGLTQYHPLRAISSMPASNRHRLNCNLRQYQDKTLHVQRMWRQGLGALASAGIIDLYGTHSVPEDYAALRYPILVESAKRCDELYTLLRQQGLGASSMYAQAMPDLDGVSVRLHGVTAIPNARDFAARLLTLPTHDDVDGDIVQRTIEILTQ